MLIISRVCYIMSIIKQLKGGLTILENEKDFVPAKSKSGAYLLVHFVGNEPEQERIHFAVSRDGYHFKPLNSGREVILQTKGSLCVRDPYILRGRDGFFYIIATDMRSSSGWTSNHALITWRSENLVDWTDETVIDIRDFGGEFSGTDRAWAPQALWDDEAQSYMVYWASSTSKNDVAAMYFAHTTDFKNITFPTLMYAREGIQTIDGDIVFNEQNGKYYMYFKHDEDQTIAFVTADRPTGPYTDPPTVVSLADSGVEGSEIYRITGTDTWIMMMDEYGAGRFIAQQTKDMEHFLRLPDSAYSYGPNPRHGSVLAISDKEYDALVTAFGI